MRTRHVSCSLATTLALALGLGACEPQTQDDPEPVEPTQKKEAAAGEETQKQAATKEPEAPAKDEADGPAIPELRDLKLHPYSEEFSTAKITWLGDNKKLKLHEGPATPSPQTGELMVKKGDEIEWQKTRTHVLEPRAYTADEDLKLGGVYYMEEDGTLAQEPREVSFKRGDILYLYHYAGEGTCYVGWQEQDKEEFVLANSVCPSSGASKWSAAEEPDELSPQRREWWVMVEPKEDERGWILIEGDSFKVEPAKQGLGD